MTSVPQDARHVYTADNLDDPRGVLANALALAAAGHPIVPCYTVDRQGRCTCYDADCTSAGKHPMTPNGLDNATTDAAELIAWFKRKSGKINYGWRCDRLAVVDVDTYGDKTGEADIEALQAEHEPLTPTLNVRTGRNGLWHVYALPAGVDTALYTDALVAGSIDFKRGSGHYVMVPGSKTVDVYRIESGQLLTYALLPQWLHELALKLGNNKSPSASKADQPTKIKWPVNAESCNGWIDHMLLDRNDPGRGNNNSLSVVGGAVEACVRLGLPFTLAVAIAYNYEGASTDPQQRSVIEDQVAWAWDKEVTKQRAELGKFSESTGYLRPRDGSHGYATLVDNRFGKPEETPFGDFTVAATGVYTQDGRTVWTLDLTHKSGRVHTDVELTHEILSSTARLRVWLQGYRCSLFFSADRDSRGPAGTRLQALLESQNPADYRVVDRLGWDDKAQAFVTYEGAITAAGVDVNATVRPNRGLAQHSQVNHYYGFRPEDEVRAVVREVLTFQEPTYAAVFGAWYVASVAKGLLMSETSLFPFLCVEAPAESGKTKGMPSMWYQLSGNRDAESGTRTAPAFRDAMAAHRGAPVWIDDAEAIADLKENLRQAVVEGYATKMGEDRVTQIKRKLTAPVLISAEGVASVHEEKAMRDRSVLLHTPDAKGRVSLNDPARAQWDDILGLQARYPDGLSALSGTLVQLVLRYAPARVAEFKSLRPGSGRHADKAAIFRVGARILADIVEDESWIKLVDDWAMGQEDTGAENALTLKVVPALVGLLGLKDKPVRIDRPPHHGVPSPVIYRAGTNHGHRSLWINFAFAAQWVVKNTPGGKVNERTETESALRQQGLALGMKGGRAGERGIDWVQAYVQGDKIRPLYQRLPDDVTTRILAQLDLEYADEEPGHGKARLTPTQVEAIERA